jgi:hypothetical protein
VYRGRRTRSHVRTAYGLYRAGERTMNELLLLWSGYILWICLFILGSIACIGLSVHIFINYILFPKQVREDLYYFIQHKKKIKEYIMKEKKE